MTFPNIVHHSKKLEAILNQAQGYLKIEQAYGSFSKFLWSYVNGKPKDLQYKHASYDRITVDDTATQLSKDLKQLGLRITVQ